MAAASSSRETTEKPVVGKPAADVAFALQHVFGIDHYRGANLSKLSVSELDRLAHLLEAAKARVTAARGCQAEADRVATLYKAPSSQLQRWQRDRDVSNIFVPGVAGFVSRPPHLGVLARRAGCAELTPWTYVLDVLKPEACAAILKQCEDHADWLESRTAPASSPTRIVPECVTDPPQALQLKAILKRCGLAALESMLLDLARRMASLLYPSLCALERVKVSGGDADTAGGLDWSYGYVASYQADGKAHQVPPLSERAAAAASGTACSASGSPLLRYSKRKGLVPHTDDSEVTLNICLGRDYTGGELELRGLRETKDEGSQRKTVRLGTGQALVHLGQHLHAVRDVESGERHHLILWCRSSKYRAAACPCCILHRRSSCVCDAEWN